MRVANALPATVVRRLVYAALLFALFLFYGNNLSARPQASPLDAWAAGLAGHGVPAALFFTGAGRFPVFAVLCIAVLVVGLLRRRYLPVLAVPVVALIVAWKVSDFFKDFFHRPRPDYWVAIHETSFSYASGHATLALTFYGILAYIVWRVRPPSPQRSLLLGVAVFWIVATGWSRLALGAHFLSDVIGGYLLGAAFLCLGEVAVDRWAPVPEPAT